MRTVRTRSGRHPGCGIAPVLPFNRPVKVRFFGQEKLSDHIIATRMTFARETGISEAVNAYIVAKSDAVDSLSERALRRVFACVQVRRENLSEERIKKIIESIDPGDSLDLVEQRIDEDNAALRARFVRDIKCLTSADIHRLAGHVGVNKSQTASHWKRGGRVFSVRYKNRELYPAFQFDADGKPKSVVKAILSAFPNDMTPWQTAFWFVSGSGWLGGKAPKDALDDARGVLNAARMERLPVIG